MNLTSTESLDKLIYEFQDKFVDLKRIRALIQALGGTISDLNDAYLGEELFHKRLARRTQVFLDDELRPLPAEMRERGVTMEDFERYLHARHAPEANAEMARRWSCGLVGGGSGHLDPGAERRSFGARKSKGCRCLRCPMWRQLP